MNSRERVQAALNHQQLDRPPVDLGSTPVTGAQVSIVSKLRQALGLGRPEEPVKVVEPYQMLGEVGDDLKDALGLDFVGLDMRKNLFGYENKDWKPWVIFDGTPVLVPGAFNTEPEANGDILMYPEGDRSAPPSGRMPQGGFYFDTIIRQPPIDDAHLKVEDNLEEFQPLSDEDLEHLRRRADDLYKNTSYAIIGNMASGDFGDIALVPAPFLKYPKGIRDVAEWYMSTVTRREHIREIFERQCEIALSNLELIHEAVGERLTIIYVSGADFGAQNAPLISPDAYRDLFKPFHKKVNDWVHRHTTWKTFIHSCGAVEPLISDFIGAGFDILNPVQCSAAGMEPEKLKEKYGDKICFWGGVVDTQKTLPFGTVEEVAAEVRERISIFNTGGGYVANPVHNIQAGCPPENVIEMFRAIREYRHSSGN